MYLNDNIIKYVLLQYLENLNEINIIEQVFNIKIEQKLYMKINHIYYHDLKVKKKITYLNNKIYKTEGFRKDGKLQYRYYYKDNKIYGKYKTWYKNGKLRSEYNYINGYKVGLQREWYDNGQLMRKFTYVSLLMYKSMKQPKYDEYRIFYNGIYEQWYKIGQLRYQFNYDKYGNKFGIQKSWYKNKQLEEDTYENEKYIITIKYFNNGSVKYRYDSRLS
jgi:antitoxin component YwqK of YwqJK toxin-antitoxin module